MVKELDTGLLLFMQREFGESSRLIWDTITTFGNPAVIVCVIAVVLWFKGSRPALMLLAAGLLGGIVVDLLKVIIAQPRPYYELLEVAAWRNSDGFGMPSGHAAGAVTLWGLMAVLFKRQ